MKIVEDLTTNEENSTTGSFDNFIFMTTQDYLIEPTLMNGMDGLTSRDTNQVV